MFRILESATVAVERVTNHLYSSDRSVRSLCIALLLAASWFSQALSGRATAQSVTDFPVPTVGSGPNTIVAGPDGNLWFTELNGNRIGRFNAADPSTITEFPSLPTANSQPVGIALGPDGNLWFAELNADQIGRLTPGGTLSEFAVPTANSQPVDITSGPDGTLWFTEVSGNRVGRITPSGTVTEFMVPTASSGLRGIASGPDGNLWFTEATGNQIGRITTSGTIAEFALPTANSTPNRIVAGPDGNLWFTEFDGNRIGRITTSGTISEFALPAANCQPGRITGGPDGNVWFSEFNCSHVGRITPAGTITEFPVPTASSQPFGIVSGPDGNLWLAEYAGNRIGRVDLSAQPQAITLGQTLAAAITNVSESDTYQFAANAGDLINMAITRTAGGLRPDIKVLDATGTLVSGCSAAGDCRFGWGNTEIGSCALTAGGTYTVVVRDGCGHENTGDYNLYVQRLNLPTGAVPLTFGATVPAEIAGAAEKNPYGFTARTGAVVNLTMTRTAGGLFPEIAVYDATGALVPGCSAAGDCRFGWDSTEVGSCTLTAGGPYTVVVDDGCGHIRTGSYNLTLTCLTPSCAGGPTSTPTNTAPRSATPTVTATPPPSWTPTRTTHPHRDRDGHLDADTLIDSDTESHADDDRDAFCDAKQHPDLDPHTGGDAPNPHSCLRKRHMHAAWSSRARSAGSATIWWWTGSRPLRRRNHGQGLSLRRPELREHAESTPHHSDGCEWTVYLHS